MTYEEAKRIRVKLEAQHRREAEQCGNRNESPYLMELNKALAHAIFEEAHASRDPRRISES